MSETIDDRVFLTYEEAIALLPDGDTIHTFLNPAVDVLLGADWSRESILRGLRDGKPQLAGEYAIRAGHGLVFMYKDEYIFVETRQEEKL